MITSNAEIKCSRCNIYFLIDEIDIDYQDVGIEERDMGAEIFYEGKAELSCPSCKRPIEIRIEASEYPVGSPISYDKFNVTGAEVIRGFEFLEIEVGKELYSFHDQTKLLLPAQNRAISFLRDSIGELSARLISEPKLLFEIPSYKFEEIIADIFSKDGFNVSLTKRTRDGGRDIIALRADLGIPCKYIIECKRYAKDQHVGVGIVRNLYGVQMQEGANKSVLVTTSHFSSDAKKFAAAQNTTQWAMSLKDYNDVYAWLSAVN